jgi:hypothetical protein
MRNCLFLFNSMSSFSRQNVYGGEMVPLQDTTATVHDKIILGIADRHEILVQ